MTQPRHGMRPADHEWNRSDGGGDETVNQVLLMPGTLNHEAQHSF